MGNLRHVCVCVFCSSLSLALFVGFKGKPEEAIMLGGFQRKKRQHTGVSSDLAWMPAVSRSTSISGG